MSSSPEPLLSVVVPIYNVGSYLRPCLDSLLGQHVADLEVVCVDDGSTDGSGEIADSYADKDSRVRVLHVPNGGLGRARNLGTDAAHGRFLAFVDSDDRVTRDGYEMMLTSLERSGSDFATGLVDRFTDTRSWRSGLHKMAMPRGARGTHISQMTSLVNDTTAWNKAFRRSFWDEQAFRFPEGVLYEDIPVTIPAHVLATQVDVIPRPVYEWRERGDGSLSITQRRAELKNLQDRLTAVEFASDFVTAHATEAVIRAHDTKVLTVDIPLYLDVLDVADDEYQHLFSTHMQRYLSHVPGSILAPLPVWERVAYELLARGRLDETVQLLEARKANRRAYDVERHGLNLYAKVPFLRDRAVGVPDAAYRVTNRLPVRSAVERVEIRDGELLIAGYAFIDKVALNHPWSAVRAVVLRCPATGHRVIRPAHPRRRPDLTAEHGRVGTGYDWAGFESRIPLTSLRPGADGAAAVYEAQIKLVTPTARRGVVLSPTSTASFVAPVHLAADGTHAAAYGSGGLRVAVARGQALARSVTVDPEAGVLRCELQLPPDAADDAVLIWRAERDEAPDVRAALTRHVPDRSRATATVALSDVPLIGPGYDRRVWETALETQAADAADATLSSVRVHPDFVPEQWEVPSDRHELVAEPSGGRLQFVDRRTQVRIHDGYWDGGDLVLEMTVPADLDGPGEQVHVSLRHPDGLDAIADMERSGSKITARIPVTWANHTRSLAPGTWTLQVREGEFAQNHYLTLIIEPRCAGRSGARVGDDQAIARIMTGGSRLLVRVRTLPDEQRGGFNQDALRSGLYRQSRRRPLQDTVLFFAWSGKQYSCNPRAIYEEMVRQGRDLPMLWVRRNTAVDVPEDVPSVLLGSHEFYEALATARYVVANDALPSYYEKRAGSRYLQTWHGTPLKRIGFDIEHVHFGNSQYMEQFAVEVTKWDRLISPNPYSTEIFRRAFAYHGEILETGYPRNDVFYSPEADRRAAAVRERLGLRPDQRVLLWAPTWRDDQRDRQGRYELPLPFDLASWDYMLGPDDVLLFRGHQLVQATVSSKLGGLRSVRNVTTYPDIQDLYLVADLLITDYSSVMFDFANTRRPMIFYAWDLEVYRDRLRGFYVDFEQEVPGPVVTDLQGLHDAIAGSGQVEAAAERYERFVQRYCGIEDGQASARVVSAMFDS